MKRTKKRPPRMEKLARLQTQIRRKRSARSERRIRIRAGRFLLLKTHQTKMQTRPKLGSKVVQTLCEHSGKNFLKVSSLQILIRAKMRALLTTRLGAITRCMLAKSSLIAMLSCKSSAGATFQQYGSLGIKCTNLTSLLKFRKVLLTTLRLLTMR